MTTYGQSAEQNPSGGNNLRGIYNITLKSIGAGMKKTKELRLDHVLRYGTFKNRNMKCSNCVHYNRLYNRL